MKHLSKVHILLAGTAAAACILTGCGSPRPTSGQADTETLYQVALLQSLTLGDYTGSIAVEQLKRFGDTGLGTFDGLDGEMIVLDGVVYQALSDGTIAIPEGDVTVPFANVTFFEEDGSFPLSGEVTLDELKQILNQTVQENGKNSFYMVKITGRFDTMQVRSEYAQQPPYLPLDQVMETDQVIFDNFNVSGTVIGLYCPDYMDKLNTPGWHFHFLSEDADHGGHVLSLTMAEGTVSYDRTDQFSMALPTHSAFQSLDLAVDLSEAIQQVETNG